MKELESIESVGTFRAAAKAPFYVLECGDRPTDAMLAHIKAAWHRIFPGNDRPELVILTDGLKLLYGDPTAGKPGGMMDSNGNAIPICCPDARYACSYADGRVGIDCKEHGAYEIQRRLIPFLGSAPTAAELHAAGYARAGDPIDPATCGHAYLTDIGSAGGDVMECASCKIKLHWMGTEYKPKDA